MSYFRVTENGDEYYVRTNTSKDFVESSSIFKNATIEEITEEEFRKETED